MTREPFVSRGRRNRPKQHTHTRTHARTHTHENSSDPPFSLDENSSPPHLFLLLYRKHLNTAFIYLCNSSPPPRKHPPLCLLSTCDQKTRRARHRCPRSPTAQAASPKYAKHEIFCTIANASAGRLRTTRRHQLVPTQSPPHRTAPNTAPSSRQHPIHPTHLCTS